MSKQKIINIAVAAAMVVILAVVFFTMNGKCNELSAQLSAAQKNAAASQGEDALVIEKLTAQLAEMEAAKKTAESELTEMSTAMDTLGAEHNKLLAQLSDAQAAQEDAEKKLSTTSELAVEFKTELDKTKEQLNGLESTVKALEAQVDKLTAANTALTTSEAGLKEQLAEAEGAKSELELQVTALTEEKAALQAKLDELNKEEEVDWEAMVGELNTAKAELEQQVTALTEEKAALQAKLDELNKEGDVDWEAMVAELTAAKTELEAAVAVLTDENAALKEQIASQPEEEPAVPVEKEIFEGEGFSVALPEGAHAAAEDGAVRVQIGDAWVLIKKTDDAVNAAWSEGIDMSMVAEVLSGIAFAAK